MHGRALTSLPGGLKIRPAFSGWHRDSRRVGELWNGMGGDREWVDPWATQGGGKSQDVAFEPNSNPHPWPGSLDSTAQSCIALSGHS